MPRRPETQQQDILSSREQHEHGTRALEGIALVDKWLKGLQEFQHPVADGWLNTGRQMLPMGPIAITLPKSPLTFNAGDYEITVSRRNDEEITTRRMLSRRNKGHSTWVVERNIVINGPDGIREINAEAEYRKSGPENETTVIDGTLVVVDQTGRHDNPQDALSKIPGALTLS